MEQFFQQLLNGLAVGGIYALVALGYTMVYGVLKLITFAHGDLFTIGAYLGLTLLVSCNLAGVLPPLQEQGVYLAAQCCEHLNRAIVLEREAAKANAYQIVSAIPQPHAGGSWATSCWRAFKDPVLVEEVRAAAGMDIGGTLIGMHLRRVAVPVRLSLAYRP